VSRNALRLGGTKARRRSSGPFPVNHLRVVRAVPGDVRDVMGEPIVKDVRVFLYFPPVWQRNVLTLLVNPVVHRAESKAPFGLEELDEILHEGRCEEGGAEPLVEIAFGKLLWDAEDDQVVHGAADFLGRQRGCVGVKVEIGEFLRCLGRRTEPTV
jgi:hypothetical protein